MQGAFYYCLKMKGDKSMDAEEINSTAADEQKAAPKKSAGTNEVPDPGKETGEKIYETALRKLLGASEDEELSDLDSRIEAYGKGVEAKLAAARDQVITAELKAMTGYDTKSLERLIDRTKITVDDSGKVTGLKEAVKQIAAEFPAVVLPKERQPYVPVGAKADSDEGISMNDIIRGKR